LKKLNKKSIIFGSVAFSTVAVATAAFALIAGFVNAPNADTGTATGAGGGSCQSGAITFDWPVPTYSNTTGVYAVDQIAYSGISPACVTAGDADLFLNISFECSPNSVATGSVINISATSGNISLSADLDFVEVPSATVNFLVSQ
jgi:hypothetical protein